MNKVVCPSHSFVSCDVIHTSDRPCPMCEILVDNRQLFAALEAGISLPAVPDRHHTYALWQGRIRLIGPNMGFCYRAGDETLADEDPADEGESSTYFCTHPEFVPVQLPLVRGCRVLLADNPTPYKIADIDENLVAILRYDGQLPGTPPLRAEISTLKQETT